MFRNVHRAVALAVSLWLCTAGLLRAQTPTIVGPTSACVGETDTYTVSLAPPGGVAWQPPALADVIALDAERIVVRWTSAGTATVIADPFGIGANLTLPVTVVTPQELVLSANNGLACNVKSPLRAHCLDDITEFSVNSEGPVAWTSTGVVVLSSDQGNQVSATYATPGMFTVTATGRDANGCNVAQTYNGVISPPVVGTIAEASFGDANPIRVCLGQDLSFVANLAAGSNPRLTWRLSNGVEGNGRDFDYTFDQAGQYTLQLFGQGGDNCGCENLVDEVTVIVELGERFELLCPKVVCAGEEVAYQLDLSRGLGRFCQDVTWAFEGETSVRQDPVIPNRYFVVWSATAGGSGTVTLTPGPGCVGCPVPTVIDVPILGGVIEPTFFNSCPVQFANITVPNFPGAEYTWSVVSDPDNTIQRFVGARTGALIDFRAGAAGAGRPAVVRVVIRYEIGDCSSQRDFSLVRGPDFALQPTPSCLGADFSVGFRAPGNYVGSVTYTYGTSTGRWDLSTGPISLGAVLPGVDRVVLSDYVIQGLAYPRCQTTLLVEATPAPSAAGIEGPLAVCPQTPYTYAALVPPGFTGQVSWEVIGGAFSVGGGTTATGNPVVVEWDGGGGYRLSATLISEGGCAGPSVEIYPQEVQEVVVALTGNLTPCVDDPAGSLYTLVCGGGGQPCAALTNIRWSVDPALGSIISGQGTPQATIRWLLPLGSNANPSVIASYTACEELRDAKLEVNLQVPGEVKVGANPNLACAGETVTFTATGNTNLTVTSIQWTVVDQEGHTYGHTTTTGNTWTWDSGSAVPEVSAGIARVYARLFYNNCSFVDLGAASFELLYNPIPVLSYVEQDGVCDANGNPIPSTVRLVTSNSAGASTIIYVWERDCGQGFQAFQQGIGLGTISVLVDPLANCTYRVRMQRQYTRAGLAPVTCARVSNPLAVTWTCGSQACGLNPQVDVTGNGGYNGSPLGCGTVTALGNSNGQPEVLGLNYGEWSVLPQTTPPLSNGPVVRTTAFGIAQFSNVDWTFQNFRQPGLYYLSYTIGRGSERCTDREPVEITLVPALTAQLSCSPANEATYKIKLNSLTDVISGANTPSYTWTVTGLQGATLLSGTTATVDGVIPAPVVGYMAQICLTAQTPALHVNPGTPYACQVCKPLFIPGRPIVNFEHTPENLCAGTAFDFTFTDPNDPFGEYVWDFGDGSGSRQPNPIKVYNAPGTYVVRLTYTNSIGCESKVEREFTVNEGDPSGDLTVDIEQPCGNAARLDFQVTGGTGPYVYSWRPLVVPSTDQQVRVTSTGVYAVSITDALGCRFDAPPVAVTLTQPFVTDLSMPVRFCANESIRVQFVGVFGYVFRVSFDGGPTTEVLGSFFITAGQLSPGIHTVSVTASNFNSSVICATQERTFEVLAVPATPVIALLASTCEPNLTLTYGTQSGETVDWYVNSRLSASAPTITVSSFDAGKSLEAVVPGEFCASTPARVTIPGFVRPEIVGGCFEDCDELPTTLRDVAGGSYTSWAWVFTPEGSTMPAVCAATPPPGPGTGPVTPWTNYQACGDGVFSLVVSHTYAGTTCDLRSDTLLVNCQMPQTCTPPQWTARNLACLAGVGGTEYYVNFDVPFGETGSSPCGGASVTLTGGTAVGSGFVLTIESQSYNIEGRVLVPTGTSLSAVCLTIPYCDGASRACGAETVCLSEYAGDPPLSNCPQGCGTTLAFDDITWGCPRDQPSQERYLTTVAFENLVIPLPTGCTPDAVRMYPTAGQIGDRTASWQLITDPQGNQDWRIVGIVSGGTFRVPSLAFDYITYANQRQACFNVFLGSCGCAVSVCVDVPLGCYPPDENPTVIPLVDCGPQAEGLQTYQVWLPLRPGETLSAGSGVVGLSAGGTGTILGPSGNGVRLSLTIPVGATSTWVLLGDPSATRPTSTLNGPLGTQPTTVTMPGVLPGDVVRYVRLPLCDGGSAKQNSGRRSALPPVTDFEQRGERVPELQVAPNPAQDRVTVWIDGTSAEAEVDWSSLRLYGVEGAQRSLRYAGPAAGRRMEVSVRDLPPGTYFLTARTTAGLPVSVRFVKQ